MEESDIIKSGVVCLPVKNFLKTTWMDKFCVLHRTTAESHAFIEVFQNQKAFKTRQKDCDIKRFELRNITSIKRLSENTSKGSEYKIEIQCENQKPIILMFNDKQDFTDWHFMLNNINGSQSIKGDSCDEADFQEVDSVNDAYGTTEQVNRFLVDVEPSDLAKLCSIVGKMTMLILPTRCAFENVETKKTMYQFELFWIHKYNAKKEQFTFEVSEKCPNGEGTITCNTFSANMINRCVQSQMSNLNLNAQVAPNNSSVKENQEIKKSTLSATETDQHNISSSRQVPPRNQEPSGIKIGEPISASIMVKKHPFASKTPLLIPIKHIEQDDEISVLSQPITKPTKDVIRTSKELDDKAKVESGAVRVANKKKEREKEQSNKKKDKEDKKEKDRLLKEEKREREKIEKERKRKEKIEKKKLVPSKKLNSTKESMQSNDSESYSEVSSEPFTYAQCEEIKNDTVETPAATPINKHNVDNVYAEPVSSKRLNEQNKNSNQGKKGVTDPGDFYTEVSQFKTAWKNSARKEEDEHHEEDYSNLHNARNEMGENPPIPQRQYLEDSDDDTYDTTITKVTGSKGKQMIKNKVANENIYGVAGGKAVNVGPTPYSSGDNNSDTAGTDTENAYGYAVPDEVKPSSFRVAHVQSYDDTNIHKLQSCVKPKSPTISALATETLYEEI